MKMSEKTLLKKIEQAFKENYCNGTYKLELEHDYDDNTYYMLYYTYETGETIALDITVTLLGEVKFYSPVHCHYISNFNNHIKSVINALRMLFDLIDSNKEVMINYYEIKTEEPEEPVKEVMEVKQELNARFGKEQYFDTDSLQPNKTISAKCEQVHKQMKAISNPEWHHVSLKTLTNIDFDMLDEKRKVYLSFYKKWQEVRKNLRKCRCGYSYERCRCVFRRSLTIALDKKKISKELVEYFDRQISMVNVECGVWSSAVEVATGQHESRKYNRANLRY